MFESFSTNVSIAGEDLLRVFYRLFYLQFCDSSEKTLCSKGFTSNLRDIFTKIVVTIIPTDLVTNLLVSSFCPFLQTKTRIWFSASWWSGNKKYFCLLFMESRALLQSHTEFKDFYKRNFLTCYSCSYYSSMFRTTFFASSRLL